MNGKSSNFYHHVQGRFQPFEHNTHVATVENASSKDRKIAQSWCGDDQHSLEISDNGDHGDGIEVTINWHGRLKPTKRLLWCKLAMEGAEAIALQLLHIVKLRQVERKSKQDSSGC